MSSCHPTFRAVADGTRRAILDALACREHTVTELCRLFEVSQPRVSQQLKVLKDAGLVHVRREGRLAFYFLDARPLRELYDWAAHYERFWKERLGMLSGVLDRLASKGRKERS